MRVIAATMNRLFCQRYWLAGVGGCGSGRRALSRSGVQTEKNRNKSNICDNYVTCVDVRGFY